MSSHAVGGWPMIGGRSHDRGTTWWGYAKIIKKKPGWSRFDDFDEIASAHACWAACSTFDLLHRLRPSVLLVNGTTRSNQLTQFNELSSTLSRLALFSLLLEGYCSTSLLPFSLSTNPKQSSCHITFTSSCDLVWTNRTSFCCCSWGSFSSSSSTSHHPSYNTSIAQ